MMGANEGGWRDACVDSWVVVWVMNGVMNDRVGWVARGYVSASGCQRMPADMRERRPECGQRGSRQNLRVQHDANARV